MTIGKFFSRCSIRGLNIARQMSALSDEEIVECIRQMRTKTLNNLSTSVYLESNCSWGSLVDLLPAAFTNARVAYIIRDPRSWLRSWMNIPTPRYSRHDIRSWFKNSRLTPHHINGDPNRVRWKDMTMFEKSCWFCKWFNVFRDKQGVIFCINNQSRIFHFFNVL